MIYRFIQNQNRRLSQSTTPLVGIYQKEMEWVYQNCLHFHVYCSNILVYSLFHQGSYGDRSKGRWTYRHHSKEADISEILFLHPFSFFSNPRPYPTEWYHSQLDFSFFSNSRPYYTKWYHSHLERVLLYFLKWNFIYSSLIYYIPSIHIPLFQPFLVLYPHQLLLHFFSEKGRLYMDIKQTWHIKLQ